MSRHEWFRFYDVPSSNLSGWADIGRPSLSLSNNPIKTTSFKAVFPSGLIEHHSDQKASSAIWSSQLSRLESSPSVNVNSHSLHYTANSLNSSSDGYLEKPASASPPVIGIRA
jgi:hypothetical protein